MIGFEGLDSALEDFRKLVDLLKDREFEKVLFRHKAKFPILRDEVELTFRLYK